MPFTTSSTYRQTPLHSYLPVLGFNTCCCQQFCVPSGGNCGGRIGAIEGGAIGQTLGGHMGGISRVLVHKGTFCPFVHLHTHSAFAPEMGKRLAIRTPTLSTCRAMLMPLSLGLTTIILVSITRMPDHKFFKRASYPSLSPVSLAKNSGSIVIFDADLFVNIRPKLLRRPQPIQVSK